MTKKHVIILGLFMIAASLLTAILLYPAMPAQMASHWNAAGHVNGYMHKAWALFMMPGISALMLALFLIIPEIAPLKKNIRKFEKYYNEMISLLIAFMYYIYLLTVIYNLGIRFSMTQAIIPAMALLFFYIGIVLKKAKRNYFVGIRTPWTLDSDKVWEKTHRLGGPLFQASAIISLLGMIFPSAAIWFLLVPILGSVILLFFYSYYIWR